jgi:hypothetical protein
LWNKIIIKACTKHQQAKYDENPAVGDCNVSVDDTKPLKHAVEAVGTMVLVAVDHNDIIANLDTMTYVGSTTAFLDVTRSIIDDYY